jgi:L-ascorbate metabolism protein UlaG (beta-lactamase superfamily)
VDRVVYLGHSTVLIELDGARLLTDPLFRRRIGPLLTRRSSPASADAVGRVDAVLISHWHRDHLDLPSLRRLPRETPIVTPRGTAAIIRRAGFAAVTEVVPGHVVELAGMGVLAVPADHGGPRTPLSRARAAAVGYVAEAGSSRIYFAGDTGLFDEMKQIAPVDLALLPIAGWGPALGPGHMNPRQAAEALALLRPAVAVPIHWGTIHLRGLGRGNPRWLTEPASEFAHHAADTAPDVDVRILDPGESVTLPSRGAP